MAIRNLENKKILLTDGECFHRQKNAPNWQEVHELKWNACNADGQTDGWHFSYIDTNNSVKATNPLHAHNTMHMKLYSSKVQYHT